MGDYPQRILGYPREGITYDTLPMQPLAKASRKLDPFMTALAPIIVRRQVI